MRFIKVLGLVLLFFVSMLFFVQNTQVLSQPITLRFDLFMGAWQTIPLPFYFLLLMGFLVGALATLVYFIAERIRLGAALRRARKQIGRLEKEVNSLRTLPLEEANQLPAAEVIEEPAAEKQPTNA
ncbi:LapA family protein [Oleidesulfovibrio sp.]|uniref:LapA family protein n=1 Tax=Oleidesulfovibrio sp. TaxID=2909707 RepID=UPI003A87757C